MESNSDNYLGALNAWLGVLWYSVGNSNFFFENGSLVCLIPPEGKAILCMDLI